LAGLVAEGVCTDSRLIRKGNLFIALIGEKYNGHDYCKIAAEAGASLFLISDRAALPDGAVGILVSDTLAALQSLACYYRNRMNCKVLAITGSVGKTSTREMITTALSSSMITHSTAQNNNNEIGLPMTILSAPENTELLVVEMGMRMKGEIQLLTHIAQPDIAVVTNIGVSHIERLGSKENILSAKMEICEGLQENGLLVVNGDDELLKSYVCDHPAKLSKFLGVTSFSHCTRATTFADYCVFSDNVVLTDRGTSFTASIFEKDKEESRVDFSISAVGAHHVKNALITIVCAKHLGVDIRIVREELKRFMPFGSRGTVIQTQNYIIYDDAYNASPESMSAAFESIRLLAGSRRKIAVIGGILELGGYSAELHRQVGISAAISGMDRLYICGENREDVKNGAMSISPEIEAVLFEKVDDLVSELIKGVLPGDVILIKASHAFGFEKISEEIIRIDRLADTLQTEEHIVEGQG
jgi:UDP-N-acetylmuramoyl-tripeptide--D-alanyl-D-alanine ligase